MAALPKHPPAGHAEPSEDSERATDRAWRDAASLELSLDLLSAARSYLALLRAVAGLPCLTSDRPTIARAVARYTFCWLPLLHEASQEASRVTSQNAGERGCPHPLEQVPTLCPPLDVLWVWACHRLHPAAYARDCRRVFRTVLDCPHHLLQADVTSESLLAPVTQTRALWSQRFPQEPFDLDLPWLIRPWRDAAPCAAAAGADAATDQAGGGLLRSYQVSALQELQEELVEGVLRQASFCYQVARPHFWDSAFLASAVQRYQGFLYLMQRQQLEHKATCHEGAHHQGGGGQQEAHQGVGQQEVHQGGGQQASGLFCVPTYDIDLLWHAHQLLPSAYALDCASLFGGLKDHDDSHQDRAPGSKLSDGFRDTELAWEALFGRAYAKAGCMNRGAQPDPLDRTKVPLRRPKDMEGPLGSLCLLTLPPPAPSPGQVAATAGLQGPGGQQPKEGPSTLPGNWGDRMMVEAVLSIRGMDNFENVPSYLGRLCLRVEALAGFTGAIAESEPFQAGAPAPRLRLCCGFSLATRGLRICLARPGGGRVLGSAEVEWERGLAAPSGWDGALPLRVTSEAGKRFQGAVDRVVKGLRLSRAVHDPDSRARARKDPRLLLSLSVTAPTQGNRLLALVPSLPVTDLFDRALLIKRDRRADTTKGSRVWRTRTAVDHTGAEKYVLRTHEGSVESVQPKLKLNAPQGYSKVRMELWEGAWVPQTKPTGLMGGDRLPSKKAGSVSQVRLAWNKHAWRLSPERWALTVAVFNPRDPRSAKLIEWATPWGAWAGQPQLGIALETAGGVPAALFPGRVLQFQVRHTGGVAGARADLEGEEGSYATLVRFPPDAPMAGRATALINFATGAVEVEPGESAAQVLLLCAALGTSASELKNSAGAATTPGALPASSKQLAQWRKARSKQRMASFFRPGARGTADEWGAWDARRWYRQRDDHWYLGYPSTSPAVQLTLASGHYGTCGGGVCAPFAATAAAGDDFGYGSFGGWGGGGCGGGDGGGCGGGGCGGGCG